MWSDAAQSVWGKSRQSDDSWLPLYQHLEDSAAVSGLLWDHWLPPIVRRTLSAGLAGGEADGRVLVTWLAGIHDVGKAAPAFAVKGERLGLTSRMRARGLDVPTALPDGKYLPHGLAGHHILLRWLKDRYGTTPLVAATFAGIVGGHHGVPPIASAVKSARERPHLVGTGPWEQVQDEFLDGMAARTGADERLSDWVKTPPTIQAQVLLTAVVIVSDWLASDDSRFPYEGGEVAGDRAMRAWEDLKLPPPWSAGQPPRDVVTHLTARFPPVREHGARPVQVAAVDAAWQLPEPGIMVIEAPMGVGKTEAALGAAEVLAARFGCGGVFIALPTMATTDAMFSRVREWVEHLPGHSGHGTSMYLAHGKAHLNDEFAGLARDLRTAGVYDDADGTESGVATVSTWLSGRKKGPLANVVVGTIDQVLFSSLQSRHLALRHLALAGKVLIVDEVHAADDYMRAYLSRALEWLGAYGVPVLLLSATLPSSQCDELLAAYRSGRSRRPGSVSENAVPDAADPTMSHDDGYPVVTVQSGGTTSRRAVDAGGHSLKVALERIADDDESLVRVLTEALTSGGCAAVLRNTVRRAQQTAQLLQEVFGDDVMLCHSRFVAVDRLRRENTLRDQLGPPSADPEDTRRPHRLVVVGTQVLEQSLDVDFDLMITDLAPVDLLLQRVGRLHRHRRGPGQSSRPPALRTARCFVSGADWSQSPPVPDGASQMIYSASRLLRSAAVLDSIWERGSIELPHDIPGLVQSAYGAGTPWPEGWADAIRVADEERRVDVAESVGRAKGFLLQRIPPSGSSLVGWLPQCVGEARDDSADGHAQVRDSEDGIEVVVAQLVDDQVQILDGAHSQAGVVVPRDFEPEHHIAKALAACTLRLPAALTRGRSGDQAIDELERRGFPAWQQSRWLRGQLVLLLNEDLEADLAGFHLSYDHEHGLQYTRSDGERS